MHYNDIEAEIHECIFFMMIINRIKFLIFGLCRTRTGESYPMIPSSEAHLTRDKFMPETSSLLTKPVSQRLEGGSFTGKLASQAI